MFGLITSEKNIFFRNIWFIVSKFERTLRAAENFIVSSFHPTGKVDRVNQSSFKSVRP